MAVYEYICLDCASRFDVIRPMSKAGEPIHCVRCESERTRRALSLFAAQTHGEHGQVQSLGSGCGCGGSCACGHNHN
ncbi:MAG: zinc ribbon domain-containing protein [Chloroflexi bacterium]|nr:zinc ribbon domain-containing protein [Chloroflexota bacterium]